MQQTSVQTQIPHGRVSRVEFCNFQVHTDRSVKTKAKPMTKIKISDLLYIADDSASPSRTCGPAGPSQTSRIQSIDSTKESNICPETAVVAKMEAMCMSNSPRAVVDGVITGFIESSHVLQKNGDMQCSGQVKAAKTLETKKFSASQSEAKACLKQEENTDKCMVEQPFLRQILEDLISKSTARGNGCSEWSSEHNVEEAHLIASRTCAQHEQRTEKETLVLPNVYVRRSEMQDWVMDVSEILPDTCVEKSWSDSDMFEEGKQWKMEASLKERREKRRIAARAARMEREDRQSDDETTGGRTIKALEKRMKNRAAVNKCRLKQRERIAQFEREKRELERENRMMKGALRVMEKWEALSNFTNVL